MKTSILILIFFVIISEGCNKNEDQTKSASDQNSKVTENTPQNIDNESKKDIVKTALASKDHTTLVTAIKAADLVVSLSNSGPFTVFAPVNSAFEKLPAGTVDELLKPENKSKLASILQHHVAVAVYTKDILKDGMNIGMVDGKNAKVTIKDGITFIDKAKIIATVPATNGIIYVVDEVILPQ